MKRSFFLLFALILESSLATEVDHFTDREVPLADSRELLNLKMNSHISLALNETNKKLNCEDNWSVFKDYFYAKLLKKVGGFFWAKFETDVVNDPSVDKRYIERKDSIYKNLNYFDGIALYMAKLGAIVNIADFYVGTDKLGHFLDTGKIYFDKMRAKGGSLKGAMSYGVYTEETFFGLGTTGIYSYGDLVANYEGLLFWKNLMEGSDPHIKCLNGSLILVKAFDWLDHVNEAWDESINCSKFRTESIKNKVYREIESKCPVRAIGPKTLKRYSGTPVSVLNL